MLHTSLLPDPELVRVDLLIPEPNSLTLVVVARRPTGTCPDCQQPADRVHSQYQRTLAEQPWNGFPVRLQLRTRRWKCDRPECTRRIFTERLPRLARRYARRTEVQARQLWLLAYVLGGEGAARTAAELGMPISADTLLRHLRQRGTFQGPAPRVLGVDDFALARGQRYGTLLVDLERGEPIDLLPDRAAQTLATWLQEHPGAELISRDRGGSYAEGARQGAPAAVQGADRFHLLKNLTDALGDVLAREQPALCAAAVPPEAVAPDSRGSAVPTAPDGATAADNPTGLARAGAATTTPTTTPARPTAVGSPGPTTPKDRWDRRSQREQEQSALSRERRVALYQEVHRLHHEGMGVREIARHLGLSHVTVGKYLAADCFPERKERATPASELAPYAAYLRQRWDEGCHNSRLLWEELRARGFTGKKQCVWRFTKPWRDALPEDGRSRSGLGRAGTSSVPASPAPRTVVWWLLCPQKRTEEQRAFAARLLAQNARVQRAEALVREFFALARMRKAEGLEAWVTRAEESELTDLVSFARGLRRDWAAVIAGLTLPWSNGPVEGQINRLKLLKRQMYGRAGLALLRSRVLPGTVPP